MNVILYKIEQILDDLSRTNRKIGVYLIKNPEKAVWFTAKELAQAADVSQAAVLRFCKILNVSNYNELKILISKDISQQRANDIKYFNSDDFQKDVSGNLLNQIVSSLNDTHANLQQKKVIEAAKLLYEARFTMCAGIGASHLVAEDLSQKLLRMQKSVFTYYDIDLRKVAITQYNHKDLLIAISYSGKKHEILELAKLAKDQNVPIIAITRVGETPLSELATVTLEVASFEHEYRISALSSRISQLYLVDVLFYTFGLLFQEEAMDRLRKTYDIINK